ncbi:uncharacterized protein MEPE_00368 [Melanopsichium pennsylvanicum]|uniref:Methyltransferase domain-containing protein n=2 Tax=Melanopsichium pennsylvanicum TaxID=63383 RepID=A0AAJ4XGF2_9BASI|nr:conserved hypothetical protein [Melanopsichium pennsylvanicum 4]SNX81663.1 uncharacterized protein MEPE_00368 [Melanopsichium pennsylvanicum]
MSNQASSANDLVTQANKDFYAKTAAEYDKIGKGMVVKVAKTNAANILNRVPGIDDSETELMDFAAGTGLLAMFLAPRCKTVTALDQMADILTEAKEASQLEGKTFDVITCTNSYHHIPDPTKVTQILADFLKPGGYLAVVDLIKTDHSAEFHNAPITIEQADGTHRQVRHFSAARSEHADNHGDHHQSHSHAHIHNHGHSEAKSHNHQHVIAHRGGFTKDQIQQFFTSAGLSLVDWGKSAQFEKHGKTYDNFLAIARKSA